MKKKIKYTEGPIGEFTILNKDSLPLPPPNKLVFKEDQVKVTISLSKSCVDFFKKEAKKQKTQYQKMIRNLLDIYVAHHK